MSGPEHRSHLARIVDIVLRTGHLGSMAALTGGVLFGAPPAELRPWLLATLASGGGLLLSELSHSRHWIYQGRGVLALAHLGVLAALSLDGLGRAGTFGALLIGAVGSHLPKAVRRWSLRHRRVMD